MTVNRSQPIFEGGSNARKL